MLNELIELDFRDQKRESNRLRAGRVLDRYQKVEKYHGYANIMAQTNADKRSKWVVLEGASKSEADGFF